MLTKNSISERADDLEKLRALGVQLRRLLAFLRFCGLHINSGNREDKERAAIKAVKP